jgi:hypothetical protein
MYGRMFQFVLIKNKEVDRCRWWKWNNNGSVAHRSAGVLFSYLSFHFFPLYFVFIIKK